MSNHFHVVLHINELQAASWSTRDIIEHWHSLYKGNLITRRYLQGEPLIKAELNESIARKANEENL